MGFCQHDAGILQGGKLSPVAKKKIFSGIKNEIGGKTNDSLFKCGPKIEPIPNADKIDLEDASKFGNFHTNVLNMFEGIVKALDFQGQFMFAPVVFDPIALAGAIEAPEIPDIKFPDDYIIFGVALPLIAPKLGFTTPDQLIELTAKIPTIIVPQPPKLSLPSLDIKVPDFIDLFKFSNWQVKLPGLFIDLALQMPSLFVGLLSFNFDSVCSAVFKSGLFGEFDPRSVMQVAVAKVLTQSVAECIVIAIVGATVGSSPAGIVGGLGRKFGYEPPQS